MQLIPGQYISLGLLEGERLVQRPYSPASEVSGETLELYVRLVPQPRFTDLLWRTRPGQPIRVGRPKGRFVLDPDPARTSLFVATGTGIAPFIAMLRTMRATGDHRRVILVHRVSHTEELVYRSLLESWAAERPGQLDYVPTLSRPTDGRNAGWTGRTGRAEAILPALVGDLDLRAGSMIAYLCGNPDMIDAAETILAGLGFPASDIRAEHYWPKDRPPQVVGG